MARWDGSALPNYLLIMVELFHHTVAQEYGAVQLRQTFGALAFSRASQAYAVMDFGHHPPDDLVKLGLELS